MTIKGQRLTLVDLVIFAVAAAAVGYVFYRVETVLIYKWDWSAIPSYLFRWDEKAGSLVPNLLMKGLATTIRIAVWTMLVASVIGVALGIARTSARLFPRLVSWAYVEFIRNIPPVPFLFLFYFVVFIWIMLISK